MTFYKRFINSLYTKAKVAGCVIFVDNDSELQMDFCIVQKRGTELLVLERGIGVSLSEAKQRIGDTPLIVSLATESMIHKKVNKMDEQHWQVQVAQLMPKIRPEDFFVQYAPIDERTVYFSLVRNDLMESVVRKILDEGFVLYHLVVGPFAVQSLIPLMKGPELHIQTKFFEIDIVNAKLSNIRFTHQEILSEVRVGDGSVDAGILVPYASCISFFLRNNLGIECSEIKLVDESRSTWERLRKFRMTAGYGSIALALFFIGSILFLWFTAERLSATEQSFSRQSKRSQIDEDLLKQYETITRAVNDNGFSSPYRASFYADRIARAKPLNITFIKLDIFPVIEERKPSSTGEFNRSKITVTGTCSSDESMVEFIHSLNQEHWIIAIQNQVYHRKESLAPASFSFDLQVKE